MTYTATWANANAQGRLDGGRHIIRLCDAAELAEAVNRRRRLTYAAEFDYASAIPSGAAVRKWLLTGLAGPPFTSLREEVLHLVSPPSGQLGGEPASPSSMRWLWPVAGDDEGSVIVSGAGGVAAGEVGLFQQLNGGSAWTDPALAAGGTPVRAVHFNELRQAVEWLRRGRWEMPICFCSGIFSMMPDTPWMGEALANNGADEVRSLGFAFVRLGGSPPQGLADVTVRGASRIEITAELDCQVQVYRCLQEVAFVADPPTWNRRGGRNGAAWSSPGAAGGGDAEPLGTISLAANVPGSLSGTAVTAALQAMADGEPCNFLIRRADTGWQTFGVTGRLVVEFDLNSPPN